MLFQRKNPQKKNAKEPELKYNAETEKPAVRCSICTGEQVAVFRSLATGKFREVVLITNPQDLEDFKKACGITEIEKFY